MKQVVARAVKEAAAPRLLKHYSKKQNKQTNKQNKQKKHQKEGIHWIRCQK